VKHTVCDVIVFDQVEDLSFVDVSGVSQGVENAVRVEGEILSMAQKDFFLFPPPDGMTAQAGARGET